MRLLARLTVAALAAIVAAGCGGGHATTATTSTTAASTAVTARASQYPPQRALLSSPTKPITIYKTPGGAVQQTLSAKTTYGTARTLVAIGEKAGWIHVLLPTRPNRSTGWVRATDVQLAAVPVSISIDTRAHTITVRLPGRAPTTAPAAVGSKTNPTPTGLFYVTDQVQPRNPKGAYGALALGLSAHSDTLERFGTGDGQVAIHGTNEPGSIGKAVSHGCIRVDPTLIALLRQVPLGTLVDIT